jgi:hypothetical protein
VKPAVLGTIVSTAKALGCFVLEHCRMVPFAKAYCGFIASNTQVQPSRAKAPCMIPTEISTFFANMQQWSTRKMQATRREFAEATLLQYATNPECIAVLNRHLDLFRDGKTVAISGFGANDREWTDVRSLILAALVRLDARVADHVDSWTGAQVMRLNKFQVASKFENAWRIGLYKNDELLDLDIAKS